MVDRVIQQDVQEHHCRQLEQAPEVYDLEQLVIRQFRQLFETRLEVVCIPACRIFRVFDGIRARSGAEIELARRQSFHKPHFRGRDVPGQIQRAFRDSVRMVIALL